MDVDRILSVLKNVRKSGSGWMASCLCHDDRTPSLAIDLKNGQILVHCHSGCPQDEVVEAFRRLGVWPESPRENRGTQNVKENEQTAKPAPPILLHTIEAMHRALTEEARQYLRERRMLSDEVIDRYQLGVTTDRLSIPVKDSKGDFVNCRLWLSPGKRTDGIRKMLSWKTGYGAPRLFPIDQLEQDELLLCEGELDALAAISAGIPAITLTAGVTTWTEEFAQALSNKSVTVTMDQGDEGKKGAGKRVPSLLAHGCTVKRVEWPSDRPEGWDVTDELHANGVDGLKAILSQAITSALFPSYLSSL